MRVGTGYDVHRLVSGIPLVLGGVLLEYEKGLAGHSDGDALIHAVIDALLGAAGLGDIGEHFPSGDDRFRGADSRSMLRVVRTMVEAAGYRVGNVDAVVIAEKPRLAPFRQQMAARIAEDLGVEASRISIKATTTDGLGFAGRGEGIAALATALLNVE